MQIAKPVVIIEAKLIRLILSVGLENHAMPDLTVDPSLTGDKKYSYSIILFVRLINNLPPVAGNRYYFEKYLC